MPGVSRDRILEVYGPIDGPVVFDEAVALVREAVAMPIEWGTMSLVDIMARFSGVHPELSREALFEIGRCVGWQWR